MIMFTCLSWSESMSTVAHKSSQHIYQMFMFTCFSRHIGTRAWSADHVYQFVPSYWYTCLISWWCLSVCSAILVPMLDQMIMFTCLSMSVHSRTQTIHTILVHLLDQHIIFTCMSLCEALHIVTHKPCHHIGTPSWSAVHVSQFVPPQWYMCLISWSCLPVCPGVKPCAQSHTNPPTIFVHVPLPHNRGLSHSFLTTGSSYQWDIIIIVICSII